VKVMADSPRLRQLEEFLAESPDDPELRYAMAMEHLSLGDDERAVQCLRDLTAACPKYVPAFQMLGQTLLRLGREDEATAALRQGMAAAQQTGNAHALSEIQGLLDSLE
jgi:predicted Zn-dependent protease